GKFYIWDKSEIEKLLGDDAAAFINYYAVSDDGNFEDSNILFVAQPEETMASAVAKRHNISVDQLQQLLARSRSVLMAARAKRVRPGCDDKVLTAWSGMMIKSFAEAARVLDRADYLAAAVKASEFLLTTNRKDGRLLRSFKNGQAKFNGYLEDYA